MKLILIVLVFATTNATFLNTGAGEFGHYRVISSRENLKEKLFKRIATKLLHHGSAFNVPERKDGHIQHHPERQELHFGAPGYFVHLNIGSSSYTTQTKLQGAHRKSSTARIPLNGITRNPEASTSLSQIFSYSHPLLLSTKSKVYTPVYEVHEERPLDVTLGYSNNFHSEEDKNEHQKHKDATVLKNQNQKLSYVSSEEDVEYDYDEKNHFSKESKGPEIGTSSSEESSEENDEEKYFSKEESQVETSHSQEWSSKEENKHGDDEKNNFSKENQKLKKETSLSQESPEENENDGKNYFPKKESKESQVETSHSKEWSSEKENNRGDHEKYYFSKEKLEDSPMKISFPLAAEKASSYSQSSGKEQLEKGNGVNLIPKGDKEAEKALRAPVPSGKNENETSFQKPNISSAVEEKMRLTEVPQKIENMKHLETTELNGKNSDIFETSTIQQATDAKQISKLAKSDKETEDVTEIVVIGFAETIKPAEKADALDNATEFSLEIEPVTSEGKNSLIEGTTELLNSQISEENFEDARILGNDGLNTAMEDVSTERIVGTEIISENFEPVSNEDGSGEYRNQQTTEVFEEFPTESDSSTDADDLTATTIMEKDAKASNQDEKTSQNLHLETVQNVYDLLAKVQNEAAMANNLQNSNRFFVSREASSGRSTVGSDVEARTSKKQNNIHRRSDILIEEDQGQDVLLPVVAVIVQDLRAGNVSESDKKVLKEIFKEKWANIEMMAMKGPIDLDVDTQILDQGDKVRDERSLKETEVMSFLLKGSSKISEDSSPVVKKEKIPVDYNEKLTDYLGPVDTSHEDEYDAYEDDGQWNAKADFSELLDVAQAHKDWRTHRIPKHV